LETKRVLWVIDPNDPIVSKDQLIEKCLNHYKNNYDIYVQLLEYCPILYNHLKNITRLLPPFSKSKRTSASSTIHPIKIPHHIRYAYYKYPNLVEIYWRYIKETLWKDTRYYHKVVIFSQGLAELYVREAVTFHKVYIHIHDVNSVITNKLWQGPLTHFYTNSTFIHYMLDKKGYTIQCKKDRYELENSASLAAVRRDRFY
jgi:hypothetical protein